MFRRAHVVLAWTVFAATAPGAAFAQEETDSQRRVAERMAAQMDEVWDQAPEDGMANIRILLTRDGAPFPGRVSIYGEFGFRAQARMQHHQGFNSNANGRWVYEGLDPGTYAVTVEGSDRFEGFEWSREVTVAAGEAPILEIALPGEGGG